MNKRQAKKIMKNHARWIPTGKFEINGEQTDCVSYLTTGKKKWDRQLIKLFWYQLPLTALER